MAGSFCHLWLACRLAEQAPGLAATASARAALLAGAVAPDLGLFPGGPRRMSELVHGGPGCAFARRLWNARQTAAERAFAAGWLLHLRADAATHPWIERRAAALATRGGARAPLAVELAHLRVEWGCDCRLLEAPQGRLLWRPQLVFPQRGAGHDWLAEEARSAFGDAVAATGIRRGERSLRRWLRWLPALLWLCGKVDQGRAGRMWPLRRLLDRVTTSLVGGRAAPCRRLLTTFALAAPWRPAPADLDALLDCGRQALEGVTAALEDACATCRGLPSEAAWT